jgi:hypothetical protein
MATEKPLVYSLRCFGTDVEALAQEWVQAPVSVDKWESLGKFGASESQPFRVKRGALVGLAKPGHPHGDGHARAAHEKLVSDLAYELGLPVPPVVLWDPGDTFPERRVCISAWAFPQCLTWDEAARAGLITDTMKASASGVASAMVAFDTWISAQDRKADHVLVDASSKDQLGLAFIDYSFALSYTWKGENDGAGRAPAFLPVPLDDDAIRHTVARIAKFPDARVRELVTRIPDHYLLPAQRAVILLNLLSRAPSVGRLLGLA